MSIKAAVVTISDRCSSGESVDTSGKEICSFLTEQNFNVVQTAITPDDFEKIKEILIIMCDYLKVDLILTTGGTGFTSRDVTPEATKSIFQREASGISTALISGSLKITPMAMLSRLTAGIRGTTLIINLPGSAKACKECCHILAPVLHHAVDQLKDDKGKIKDTHDKLQAKLESKVKLERVALRPRESQYPMVSMNEAINIVINQVKANTQIEKVSLKSWDKLIGKVLATDIQPKVALPPFRASVKDGYAVIASDGAGPRKLIQASATAGTFYKDIKITSGYCVRVSTGAAVIDGADAVVQVEDTKVLKQTEDGEEEEISIEKAPTVGQDIRPIGCDISLDAGPILRKFTELGPIELGLLAAVGIDQVDVFKRPKVAVLSTGDEIVDPESSLSPGKVFDSNRIMLLSQLRQQRYDVIDLKIARDNVDEIFGRLSKGLHEADVVITTGGVSMGEKDLLKSILIQDFAAEIQFGRINLKPGKPTTFATCLIDNKKKFIFALPGNPISCFVTYQLFVLPSLKVLSGSDIPDKSNHPKDDYVDVGQQQVDILSFHRTINVQLNLESPNSSRRLDPRPEFVRAVISFDNNDMATKLPTATLTGNQNSSRLLSAKDANALVLLPQRKGEYKEVINNQVLTAIMLS